MSAPSSIASTHSGPSDLPDFACAQSGVDSLGVKTDALVLIPARNEAATIGRVVRGCRRAGFSVRVIDDASSDETALLASQAGAEVLVLKGPHHGKTAAL